MESWLPTRYLAAYIDINMKGKEAPCVTFLKEAIPDDEKKVDTICNQYDFTKLEDLMIFALANKQV